MQSSNNIQALPLDVSVGSLGSMPVRSTNVLFMIYTLTVVFLFYWVCLVAHWIWNQTMIVSFYAFIGYYILTITFILYISVQIIVVIKSVFVFTFRLRNDWPESYRQTEDRILEKEKKTTRSLVAFNGGLALWHFKVIPSVNFTPQHLSRQAVLNPSLFCLAWTLEGQKRWNFHLQTKTRFEHSNHESKSTGRSLQNTHRVLVFNCQMLNPPSLLNNPKITQMEKEKYQGHDFSVLSGGCSFSDKHDQTAECCWPSHLPWNWGTEEIYTSYKFNLRSDTWKHKV